MIECPDCGTRFGGYKCECGYKLPRRSAGPSVSVTCGIQNCIQPAITREYDNVPLCRDCWERRDRERTQRELFRIGLITVDEKRAMVQKYVRHVAGKQGNKDWARAIIQRHEDGEVVPDYSLSMARQALGVPA